MRKILTLSLLLSLFLIAGCNRKIVVQLPQSPINDADQIKKATNSQSIISVASPTTNEEGTENSDKLPNHLIPADQIIRMEALMSKNGKSLAGLQAYRFEKDQIGMTHIRFNFYVNGVRADETIYHFKADNTLSGVTNEPDASLYSNISTTPKISKNQAILIVSNRIKSPTLDATKEFWNKNAGSPGIKDIVLAWRVKGSDSYPLAIINAQTGEILYYDDGIRD
jgi:Zn-dependent metalloprotease